MASEGKPLTMVLSELVDLAIQHQFGQSTFAAALDHEERRLPIDEITGAAQQEMVLSIQQMLGSVPELKVRKLSSHAALDCLTITKAMVEAESASSQVNTSKLKQRVIQALQGYLLYRS
jgi:hypothetical protein